MITVSSQDFRNVYEKFYNAIRQYLWPFEVLKELSEVENDIYAAFVDVDKLRIDFAKLRKSMKDTLKEDEELSKYTNMISEYIEDKDAGSYFRLPRVNEVDPEKPKSINTIPDEEEEGLL